MLRFIKVTPLVFLLGACDGLSFLDKATAQSKVNVEVKPVVAPFLLDISHPIAPVLEPTTMDRPRDLSKPKQVKDFPECKTNLKDTNFEKNCMEYPVIPNVSIYAGFTLEGFKNYLTNQAKIDAYIQQYKNRVDEINKERQTWRKQGAQ